MAIPSSCSNRRQAKPKFRLAFLVVASGLTRTNAENAAQASARPAGVDPGVGPASDEKNAGPEGRVRQGWKGRQTQTPAGHSGGTAVHLGGPQGRTERRHQLVCHNAHRHIAMQHTLLHACYAFAGDLGRNSGQMDRRLRSLTSAVPPLWTFFAWGNSSPTKARKERRSP